MTETKTFEGQNKSPVNFGTKYDFIWCLALVGGIILLDDYLHPVWDYLALVVPFFIASDFVFLEYFHPDEDEEDRKAKLKPLSKKFGIWYWKKNWHSYIFYNLTLGSESLALIVSIFAASICVDGLQIVFQKEFDSISKFGLASVVYSVILVGVVYLYAIWTKKREPFLKPTA